MDLTSFDEFCARKTREAESAMLPPYSTEFVRPPSDAIPLGNEWSTRLFDGTFYVSPPRERRRPACSLVFVQSADGNTGARNPTALGGGETDKHLVYEGLSRAAADAVLSGAETIRDGQMICSVWHPELVRLRASLGKPRHPAQIVATLRGLDINSLVFNVPDVPVYVVTVGSCAMLMEQAFAERPWITPVVMERPSDLPRAFEQLRAHGLDIVSCIGGRRLATQLIDFGLIDDVYLTTSPRSGGEPGTPIHPRPLDGEVVVRKRGTGPELGVVFEQYAMRATVHL
jgi:5-amino-6-(5-phosphoribosylamino)uracil reductase